MCRRPVALVLLLTAAACGGSSGGAAPDGGLPDAGLLPDGGKLECGAQTACGLQCVDVSTDPANCGACAHSCQGGGCQAGACQPLTLASAEAMPMRLAINGGWLYWTDHATGEVKRVSTSGGEIQTLVSAQTDLSGICADDARVYWILQGANAGIWSATLDGGPPENLVQDSPSNAIVRIGDSVYWGTHSANTLTSLKLDGGAGVTWLTPGTPTDIATDGTTLYWGGYTSGVTSEGGLYRSSFDGGSVAGSDAGIEQITAAHIVARIAVGPGKIGWMEGSLRQAPSTHYDDAGVWIVQLDGGAPYQVASLAWQNFPTSSGSLGLTGGLASDERYLYWTDMDAGIVFRTSWEPGAIEPVISGQEQPVGLIADQTSLYWTTFGNDGGGTVMKIAK